MRNNELTIEEKLQNGNASASHRAMSSRVSRMRWRTFGESLRQQVIAVSCEASLNSRRVENIVVDTSIERSSLASQNLANDGASGFRTVTKMDVPFVIPNAV